MTDQLADAVDELLVLWPALPTALPRDAGTSDGERVATSENIHTIPINVDVASVITELTWAVPRWASWASTAAGLAPIVACTVTAGLARLPLLHHRLLELGRTRNAERLADTVHSWLTACRNALGLNRPDRPFGEMCPRHDDPLQALVVPGDHGHLAYEKLDAHGRPVDPWIRWQSLEVVLCRHCDSVWTPERFMLLGRLIRQANRDREAAAAQEADDAA